MARFFFDFIVDGEPATDLDGLDLSDVGIAKIEAAKALAEMAREAIVSQTHCDMQVQVRDAQGGLVLKIEFHFEES